jgi:hypothetical protein
MPGRQGLVRFHEEGEAVCLADAGGSNRIADGEAQGIIERV